MATIRSFTVGDRLVSLLADLYTGGDPPEPIALGPAETVVFRMVSRADGSVKVNDRPAEVTARGGAGVPAQVRYDWGAEDVDTPGAYSAWFVRQSGGETEHFPTESPYVQKLTVLIKAED